MSAGPEEIAQAVERLRSGGLVAFPTETVYGLGADALSAPAVNRVFDLKGRPATNPLIVHVSGEDMARQIVRDWPPQASRLAAAFWPGPLTLVLPKADAVPDIVTAGGPTVGVRCPDHPITLALLEAFGGPLVGPSANPSGRISPTSAEHVREAFTSEQVFILDGGPCRRGIESTVVQLQPQPRILRPGLISADDIARILGEPVQAAPPPEPPEHAPAPSPGLHPLHYAPAARAIIYEGAPPQMQVTPPQMQERLVVLTFSSHAPAGTHVIQMPADADAYAARLYAALREADALNPTLIAIQAPPREGPIWQAVWDRLRRATARP